METKTESKIVHCWQIDMKTRANTNKEKRVVDDLATEEYLRDLKRRKLIKECPRCSLNISKDGGCRKVLCSRYKCKFCWDCLSIDGYQCQEDRHYWLDNTTEEVVGNWEKLRTEDVETTDSNMAGLTDSNETTEKRG